MSNTGADGAHHVGWTVAAMATVVKDMKKSKLDGGGSGSDNGSGSGSESGTGESGGGGGGGGEVEENTVANSGGVLPPSADELQELQSAYDDLAMSSRYRRHHSRGADADRTLPTNHTLTRSLAHPITHPITTLTADRPPIQSDSSGR